MLVEKSSDMEIPYVLRLVFPTKMTKQNFLTFSLTKFLAKLSAIQWLIHVIYEQEMYL